MSRVNNCHNKSTNSNQKHKNQQEENNLDGNQSQKKQNKKSSETGSFALNDGFITSASILQVL